jgi:putative ABC transport system permease protein
MLRFPFLTPFFLALRNMRTRLGRTLLTLMGIVLGVAVVLAVQITNDSTLASIRRVFDRAAGQANLLVVPTNQAGEVLDESLLARLERSPGVEVAAPSLRVGTLLASEAESWQIAFTMSGIASGSIFQLYGIDPALDSEVRVYEISSGRMPAPESFEAALPAKYAAEKNLQLGEELVLLTPDGIARLEIVGLLAEEGVSLLNDSAVAFTPLNVVQDLFGRGGELDEIALRLSPRLSENVQRLEQTKERLSENIGRAGRVIYPAARGQLTTQMLATYQQGLTFFSLIAVFVGAFLIYNTFSMTVVERTREIGMLRTIGMNRWGVLRMVLAEAVILATLGSLMGLGGGVVLARGLITILGEVVTTSENVFTLPWIGVIQSIAVGVGVTMNAALLPAIQAARISPLEALRARGRSTQRIRPIVWFNGLCLVFVGWAILYRLEWRAGMEFPVGMASILMILLGATLTVSLVVSTLERLTRPLAGLLYGNEGALGSANVRRSVARTALTVASLMIALTMVIGVGSMAYSFKQDMFSWIDTAIGGDLYIRSVLPMRESFGRQLETVPGVAATTPTRYLTVRVAPVSQPRATLEDDSLFFAAIDPQSYQRVASMEFASGQGDPDQNWARLAQGEALFVSTTVADRYDLKQGDDLWLLTHRGAHPFTVAGIVVDFTGQGFIVTGSYADLHRWFAESGADRFTIRLAENSSVSQVAEQIKARFGESRHISIQTTEAFKKNILSLMNQSFRLFDVLNLIGVIIGALGVINTLTMNVMERQREIGGLRSLGMTRGQTLRMVLAESLAMGVIGCVYGLGFGYVIAQIMILAMNILNGYDLVYIFTSSPYLVGIAIALGISQGAALFPARRAARVNIVEAIKHE